jgi:hypothetical protein
MAKNMTSAWISRQHRRHGHVAGNRLRDTAHSDGITGLLFFGAHDRLKCPSCMLMNAKKAPFKAKATTRSTIRGERFHSDVKELSVRSKKGAKYAVCFVDDASRRGKSYSMAHKSEVVDKWKQFLEEEVLSRGYSVKYFRSDNGGEFIGELAAFNRTRGILAERSPPHCQSGNGVAENYWRETFKIVRAILWDQQRGHEWWASALHFADVIRNHTMTSAVSAVPPEAAWTGAAVDVGHFRVPLSKAWSFVEKTNREGTLAPRRMEGIFIGYSANSPCYLIYDETTKTVYARRHDDVEFDEGAKAPGGVTPEVEVADRLLAELDKVEKELAALKEEPPGNPPEPQEIQAGFIRTSKDRTVTDLAKLFNMTPQAYLELLHEYEGWYEDIENVDSKLKKGSDVPVPSLVNREAPIRPIKKPKTQKGNSEKEKIEVTYSKGVRKSLRTREGAARVAIALQAMEEHDIEWAALARETAFEVRSERHDMQDHSDKVDEGKPPERAPKGYNRAHQGPHSKAWRGAETKEWTGLWGKKAFEDQPIAGQKLHHLLWTYKVKTDGTLKARLCLDGRRQDPSTYGDVRSPTMRLTSMRIMLAMAAQHGWDLWADDAVQAFLNAERPKDKPLWASYPQGFEKPGHCMLLKKQLYGAHDSPAGWFECVRQHLVDDQGLKQSLVDECLFTGDGIFVVCHVDDFLSTGDSNKVQAYRNALHKRFKMTGGLVKEYYGLDIKNDKRKGQTSVMCKTYIERLVKKLGFTPTGKYTEPMDATLNLPKRTEPQTDKKIHKYYRTLVGSGMHPAVTCRPDVAATVRALACHLQNPGLEHVRAAERLIDYLWLTRTWALTYRKSDGESATEFFGTCDAAHNVTSESKGITGWAYQYAGGCISWKSRGQDIAALSSTEAELIAVDEAARELRYLHKLLEDFNINTKLPTRIGQDNMSTIALVASKHFNPRTKHIALRYHHCGDLQRAGVLRVEYLSTDIMPADLLTKPLGGAAHRRHAAILLGHELLAWPRAAISDTKSKKPQISQGGYKVVAVDNNDQGGGNPRKLLQVIRWIERDLYEL